MSAIVVFDGFENAQVGVLLYGFPFRPSIERASNIADDGLNYSIQLNPSYLSRWPCRRGSDVQAALLSYRSDGKVHAIR